MEAPQSTPRRPKQWKETYSPQSPTEVDNEITGSTAIASPSIVEAHSLNPRWVRKSLNSLYQAADKVLSHLVPGDPTEVPIDKDDERIDQRWDPDSDLTDELEEFEAVFETRLRRFKTTQQQFVRPRAIHHTLNPDGDVNEPLRGVDAVIYLANLANLTRYLMGSKQMTREMGNALRELDQQFPQIAISSFDTAAGGSSLYKKTFELAVELRVQYAIFTLGTFTDDDTAARETIIDRIFLRPGEDEDSPGFRGWNSPGLRHEDLSSAQCDQIKDDLGLVKENLRDPDLLANSFPLRGALLQLMDWVRLRRQELRAEIEAVGGINALSDMLINNKLPASMNEQESSPKAHTAMSKQQPNSRKSLLASRTMFARRRRRSAKEDNSTKDTMIDLLKADETTLHEESELPHDDAEVALQPSVEESVGEAQPPPAASEAEASAAQAPEAEERPSADEGVFVPEGDDWEPEQQDEAMQPPQNAPQEQTNPAVVNAMKAIRQQERVEKENQRRGVIFERQPDATRIEFGSGFDDSQATPGPSGTNGTTATAGPSRSEPQPTQPAQPLQSRKRARSEEFDNFSDSDAEFETHRDSQAAQERRRRAPVAKRARLEPTSSAPTGRQPRVQASSSRERPTGTARERAVSVEGSLEPTQRPAARAPASSAPGPRQRPAGTARARDVSASMSPEPTQRPATRAQPPAPLSGFREVQLQAAASRRVMRAPRRQRREWTPRETERFRELMELYPRAYARILQEDASMEDPVLQERDQVNLKDRARTMAKSMIE